LDSRYKNAGWPLRRTRNKMMVNVFRPMGLLQKGIVLRGKARP
jgi:hypothetical protein